MSIVKGTSGNIKKEFVEQIRAAFGNPQYKPGMDIGELAYEHGKQYVVEWIERHAKYSNFT